MGKKPFIDNQPQSGGTLEAMVMIFRPSGAAALLVALPMAYAMGYRSIAAPRLGHRLTRSTNLPELDSRFALWLNARNSPRKVFI